MLDMAGFLFIVVTGAIFHEICYRCNHKHKVLYLFCNVDGHVDDYIRLLIGPYFLWTIIEYIFLYNDPNFLTAKLLGLGAGLIVIPSFCYSYRAIVGKASCVVDILIYIVAVLCGQMFSYQIMVAADVPACVNYTSLVLLVSLFAAYIGHICLPVSVNELDYSSRSKIRNKKR